MHLSESEIERLLAARLQPADQQRVVRHLLSGCGVCSRKLIEQTPERLLDGPLRSRAVLAALRQEARSRTGEERLARSLELLRGTPRGYDDLSFQQVRALHGRPLVEAL